MPLFIVRDMQGKALGVILSDSDEAAVAYYNAEHAGHLACSAVPDNPWRAKLSHLVENSGLSNREFARRVLGRDVRSLSRYLGGDIMPPELADQIMRMSIDVDPTTITMRVQR